MAAPTRRRPRAGGVLAAATLSAVALATGLQSAASSRSAEAAARHRPVERHSHGYVSSRECRSCHPNEYRSWHRSYHRTMTQPATPEQVFGDFSGVELEHLGTRYRMGRVDGGFSVDIEPGDVGKRRGEQSGEHPIALVTGSHHMQIYWYELGEQRKLGQLPFVFLKRESRWVPRRSAFLTPPGRPRPVEHGRWNVDCIGCHTTHGQPRPSAEGELDTRVAEFGIACEACHGPGLSHVQNQASPLRRYVGYFSDGVPEDIVQPAELDHERASQVCGQCHGIWQHEDAESKRRWNWHGPSYRPGQDAEQSRLLFQPSRGHSAPRVAEIVEKNPDYTRGQFWPDGMARTSGREFNGMIDSPCYERGELSCLSCHRMHTDADDDDALDAWANAQLAEGMDGDGACLQCHESLATSVEAHTHHPSESAGSRCYNCHMPYTSYALMRGMRSHQVSSPDALTTLHTGRPNACNLCHLDKPLGWTAGHLQQWFGTEVPFLGDDQKVLSSALTWALQGDAAQRALIAHAMGWEPARRASGEHWIAPFLGLLMDDPYDTVRYIAERSLRSLGGFRDFDYAYDFVVPPTEREPAFQAVEAHWLRVRGDAPAPPSVPVLASGLDQPRVEDLLQRRNHTNISILE